MRWRSRAAAEAASPMALWEWVALSLHCWVVAVAAVSEQHATSPFDWLLSDKGPFHRSQEYTDFVDRSRQGFSTRYKIYRYGAGDSGTPPASRRALGLPEGFPTRGGLLLFNIRLFSCYLNVFLIGVAYSRKTWQG